MSEIIEMRPSDTWGILLLSDTRRKWGKLSYMSTYLLILVVKFSKMVNFISNKCHNISRCEGKFATFYKITQTPLKDDRLLISMR